MSINALREHRRRTAAARQGKSISKSCAGGFALEGLESRQLLAADLGVSFDEGNLHFPSIAVPGDNVVPDSSFTTPIRIINNGPQAAVGLVNIAFYLSTDTTLDTSSDLLMRLYQAEPVQLPVYTGNPDDIGTFAPDMRVPAETTPGMYHVIVRITYPNNQVDDFNTSNNVAVSTSKVRVERQFGNVGGRSNITMVVKDAEDTLIAFSLANGGTGSLTVDSQGRYSVSTTGTGANSDLSVTTNGGDGAFDFAGVTINGAIRSFVAPAARLVGTFTPGTTISTLQLGNVLGPTTLTIPNTSASPSITLGAVTDLSITSSVGIKSLTVNSWGGTNAAFGIITAPYLDALTVAQGGSFNASLRLSGGAAPGQTSTLRSVNINGVVNGGTWVVNGTGGTISLFASVVAWSATFSGRVTSIGTTTGTLRGVVTAASFGTVSSGKDILASRILAGAFLGQDGVFGGTGSNADTFRVGRIDRLLVSHNVANSIIAAGLKSISGPGIEEPQQLLGGVNARIGELRVGNVAGQTARFLANRYVGPTTIGGQAVDVTTNSRFQIVTLAPAAVVTNVNVSNNGATITMNFNSFGIINLGSISTGAVRVTGPNGFSQIATLTSRRFVPGSIQARGEAVFQIAAPGGEWQNANDGEYSIQMIAGTVADGRGNFVAPGEVSQFLVSA